jgi:hypothetical protein
MKLRIPWYKYESHTDENPFLQEHKKSGYQVTDHQEQDNVK